MEQQDDHIKEQMTARQVDRLGLTDDQKQRLKEALQDTYIATYGSNNIKYIESYVVIDQLNDIIGYGDWYTTHDTRYAEYGGVGVFTSKTRLYIYGVFVAEQTGGAELKAAASGKAVINAIKTAETIGLKRCARLLGNQFGNSLYGDTLDADSYVSDYGGQTDNAHESGGYGAGGYANSNGQVAAPPQPPQPNGAQAQAQAPPQSAADGDEKWERFKAWVAEQGKRPQDVAATLAITSASKSDVIAWAQNLGVGYGGVIDHLTRCWAEDDALSDSSAYADLRVDDPVGNPAEIAGGYADYDDFRREIEAFYAWLERRGITQAKVAEILDFGDAGGAYASKLFHHCQTHHARLADVQEHIEFELGPPPELPAGQGALA